MFWNKLIKTRYLSQGNIKKICDEFFVLHHNKISLASLCLKIKISFIISVLYLYCLFVTSLSFILNNTSLFLRVVKRFVILWWKAQVYTWELLYNCINKKPFYMLNFLIVLFSFKIFTSILHFSNYASLFTFYLIKIKKKYFHTSWYFNTISQVLYCWLLQFILRTFHYSNPLLRLSHTFMRKFQQIQCDIPDKWIRTHFFSILC